MRIAVIIFTLLGAVTEGMLGFKWLSDYKHYEDRFNRYQAVSKMLDVDGKSPLSEKLGEVDSVVRAAYCLIAGAFVALGAGVLVFARRISGRAGGVTLLFCAGIPAVFMMRTLLFSAPVVLAGLLSFRVRSKPAEVAPNPSDAGVPSGEDG